MSGEGGLERVKADGEGLRVCLRMRRRLVVRTLVVRKEELKNKSTRGVSSRGQA